MFPCSSIVEKGGGEEGREDGGQGQALRGPDLGRERGGRIIVKG